MSASKGQKDGNKRSTSWAAVATKQKWPCSLQRVGFKQRELTLTSSPSVCLQCSWSLGNTVSLRALRSTTLSTHVINSQTRCKYTRILVKCEEIKLMSLNYKCLLTLRVGAQIDFHTGCSEVHLVFSGWWDESRAPVKVSKQRKIKKSKLLALTYGLKVKPSVAASPLRCFSSLLLHSGNSVLTCLQTYLEHTHSKTNAVN